MNEWNYEELRSKQTELFVLKQILDAYHQIKNTDLYIEPSPLNSINDKEFTTQDFIYQHTGLERLEGKSLIRILEPSSLRGIHISIVNLSPLKELYEDLYESIPATGNLPRIVYSLKKRRGKINGKPFRFNIKSDNYILFRKLVTLPNIVCLVQTHGKQLIEENLLKILSQSKISVELYQNFALD